MAHLVKNPPTSAGDARDMGLIPGSETPPGGGDGNPLQCMKWSHSVVSYSLWPMYYSLPGSSVHGIFQASVLEWVAISFSRGSSRPRDRTQVSCIGGRCFTIWAILPWKIPWTGEPGRLKFLGLQRVWYTEHTDILCTGGPRLCISTAGGTGSIPGWGTKIPQTSRCSQKNKEPTI